MKRTSALLLLLTLVLVGCGKATEFPIPQGIQTVKGILQPVAFSLTRRGTHALTGLDGKLLSYAESKEVNLRALEGKEVTLTGIFEKNSDPALEPVLIVQKVDSVENDEDVRPWIIPALGLSLDLPKSYKGVIRGKVAEFTASGGSLPLLSITLKTSPGLSGAPLYGPLPTPSSAEAFVVGLRKAISRMGSENRSWQVSIDGTVAKPESILFTFSLRPDIPVDLQLAGFRKILRTVEFHGGVSSKAPSSFPSFPSSSSLSRSGGDGTPCGGSAGILCPSGYYCKITDLVGESGVCIQR